MALSAVTARQREVDAVTNYLCQLCSVVDDKVIDGIPGLRNWWTKHQELDKRRNR